MASTPVYKFPSIENERRTISDVVKTFLSDADTVLIEGCVKLHGTSSAIVKHGRDGPFSYQSRTRVITSEDDNAGFARMMSINEQAVRSIFEQIEAIAGEERLQWPVVVYGEWCGKGIQKGVALQHIEKVFVIFKITMGLEKTTRWVKMEEYKDVTAHPLIRNIREIPSYTFTLRKGNVVNDLAKINEVVAKIDQECPFVSNLYGIKGVGEGLVLQPQVCQSSDFWWKCKGKSHEKPTPAPKVTVDRQNSKESVLAAQLVTYERLQSAKEALHIKNDEKNVFKHFKPLSDWMQQDILREEGDLIASLDHKFMMKAITDRMRLLMMNA